MPELPEVEFMRARLEHWLGGRKLTRVSAPATRVLRGSSHEALEALSGHRVESIDRRGKWLLWRLSGHSGLLAHLGMTGKFVRSEEEARWSRARFEAADGTAVHLVDQRMFGRLLPGAVDELEATVTWSSLGPDAWREHWTPAKLRDAVGSSKSAVKVALMDQERIAGLGNIQATEALWRAHVHPQARPASLGTDDWARLVRAIHWTLKRTLDGITGDEITYVEEDPSSNPFLVYGRDGEACPRCGETLVKSSVGGRTTVWCPRCQPPP